MLDRPIGHVEVRAISSEEFPTRRITAADESSTRDLAIWRPHPEFRGHFPPDFSFAMICQRGPDGLRRFIPAEVTALANRMRVGGLGVLTCLKGRTPEIVSTYGQFWLIHRHALRSQSYSTRVFKGKRDLQIVGKAKEIVGQDDILPETLGKYADGTGCRWNVGTLIEEGSQAAREYGILAPRLDEIVQHGLLLAAKRWPLMLSDDQVPGLLRLAMFHDDGTLIRPDEETIEIVYERLIAAMGPHLEDSDDEFDRWFLGNSSSLVKQIAKQRKKRGGALDRDQVNAVMEELHWQSFFYVGQCIGLQAKLFRLQLPDPLNEAEQRLFESIYEEQSYLGGLPLVLLRDLRASVLRLPILAIWESPENSDTRGHLHQMLQFYQEMVGNRREADRVRKSTRKSLDSTECAGVADSLDSQRQIHSSRKNIRSALPATVTATFRIDDADMEKFPWLQKLDECCTDPDQIARLISKSENKATISVECSRCESVQEIEIPKKELPFDLPARRKAAKKSI